jgi:hypothetical protein
MSNKKRKPLDWFMSPRKDDKNQWWWGYQKVRMIRCSAEEKQKWLDNYYSK